MTTLKHGYTNPQPDDGDPNVTGPDEWNSDHVSDHEFVIMGAAPSGLTGTRSLAVSGLASLTDGGAGSSATIGVASAAVVAAVQAAGVALTRTNDTNVTLTLGGSPTVALLAATSLTLGWTGLLGLARGGTHADLSATGGTGQYLKQAGVGADVTVGTIPASDIVSGAALTRTNDTNVTLTLGGTPTTALLAATSLTLGWTGLLGLARGGTHTDLSATGGTGQYLKQAGAGSDITVGTIAAADLPANGANPSASVGLSAVNGSATTWMRSDGAPPLSQSITPTWTNPHTWSTNGLGAVFTAYITISNTTAATSGATLQLPGVISLAGTVWNTSGTPASNTMTTTIGLVGTSGAAPSSRIAFRFDINGGGFTEKGSVTSAGMVSATTGFLINLSAPTAGHVLRGNGTAFVDSTLAASDIVSGAALTKTDDTNVTLTLGGTPASALLAAASLTLGWTGTLSVARGGIGVGTLAVNGVLYGNTTSAVQALAVNSTATNKFLAQVNSGAPTWNTIAAGDLPANGANPSASVGLSAVNGSATTWMRSDAAPALSQSIAPTWTGVHTWTVASGSTPHTINGWSGLGVGLAPFVVSGDQGNARIELQAFNSTPTYMGFAAGGTKASPTATVLGSNIVNLSGGGYDNAGTPALHRNAASFRAVARSNWTTTSLESYWIASMTPSGSTTLTDYHYLFATGAHVGGYLMVAARTTTPPSNTTDGDITGTRGFFTSKLQVGGSSVPTHTFEVTGSADIRTGVFTTFINSQLTPSAPDGGGLAVIWNFSGGAGEVDFFNCYSTGGYYFYQRTGASTQTLLATLDATGIFTATSTVTAPQFSATSGTSVFSHATGFYNIELAGTGTGAITYGYYIDSSSSLHLDAVSVAQIAIWASNGDYQILGSNAYKASGTAWINPSDARIKNVSGNFEDGLNVVERFQPKRWIYNEYAPKSIRGEEGLGFVAQDVEDVAEYMVKTKPGQLGSEDVEDFRYFDSHALSFILVNAVKELSEQNQALLARLDALERRN